MKKKDITEYLNDSFLKEISDIIKGCLKDNPPASKWDYKFDLVSGKIASKQPNTWFMFDAKDGGDNLVEFTKALYDRELTEEENIAINSFMSKIALSLMDSSNCQNLRDQIRKSVMPHSDPRFFPLQEIYVESIDVVDFAGIKDEHKHLVKWKKMPGYSLNIKKITEYINNLENKDSTSIVDIVKHEIQNANPLFEGVLGVEVGDKYLFDINISFFVDYSPENRDEVEAMIVVGEK